MPTFPEPILEVDVQKLRLKKLLKSFALLLAVSVAAFVLLVRATDANKYKPQVSTLLSELLGRPVALNGNLSFSVSYKGISITARDALIANDPGALRPYFASIGTLELGMDTLCLFKGYLPVKELSIEKANVLLETDAAGKRNWDYIVDAAVGGGQEGALTKRRFFLNLDNLNIRDSRVAWVSPDGHGGSMHVESLSLDASQGMTLSLRGSMGHVPVVAEIRTDLEAFPAREPFFVDFAGFFGKVHVAALGKLDLPEGRAALSAYEVTSGETKLFGTLGATWASARPIINGTILSERLKVSDFAAIFQSGSATSSSSARLFNAEPLALDTMKAFDADLAVSLGVVPVGIGALRQVQGRVVLAGGYLTVAPATAMVGSAPVDVRAVFDATKSPARVDVGLMTRNIELGDVQSLSGLNAFVIGKGGAYVRLGGIGDTAHDIASSLTGVITITAGKGEIATGLLSKISSLVASSFFGERSSVVNCLAARFIVKNGVIMDNGLLLDSAASLILGRGSIDLGNETMDLSLMARPKILQFGGAIPLLQIGGDLGDLKVSVNADNIVKNVVTSLTGSAERGAVPVIEQPPTGENACVYALDHPQKSPSLGILRTDPGGRAVQFIEEMGKSLIGGLFKQ
jgi:uncharacterized protein involved in outer membrane biogenesis